MNSKPNQSIYKQMQRFADVTKQMIIMGNIQRAKRCLQIAENISNQGSAEIKNALVTVYLFSVTSFMEIHKCNIRNLLPEALKIEYKRQVNSSGI